MEPLSEGLGTVERSVVRAGAERLRRVTGQKMRTTFLDVDTSVEKFYTNQFISNLYNIFINQVRKNITFVARYRSGVDRLRQCTDEKLRVIGKNCTYFLRCGYKTVRKLCINQRIPNV